MALMHDVSDDSEDDLSDASFVCSSLDYLPVELSKHLLSFQKEGILFGIKKRGRYYFIAYAI